MIMHALWCPINKSWWGSSNAPVRSSGVPKLWSNQQDAIACMQGSGKAAWWARHGDYTWRIIRIQTRILDKHLM